MKTLFLTVIALFFVSPNLIAQAYTIDSGHSSVQIKVERFGVIDVVGRFKDVQGTISYNPEDPTATSAQSIIQVESYDANNTGGEDAVKSAIFLDAATFPEISFTSKSAQSIDGRNFLVGDLTIHGVTREINLPYSIKGPKMDLATQKQSIAFLANTTINRQDYGITFDRALPNGTLLVANDVEITLTILGIAN